MVDRLTIDVPSPPGGWGAPWPNVAEIEAVLPCEKWTLVGGLMAQLHGIHHGIDALRPTNDVDMVLHVETTRGVAADAARAWIRSGTNFLRRSTTATPPPIASHAATQESISSPVLPTSSMFSSPTTLPRG